MVPPVSIDVTAVPNVTSLASLSERATPARFQATPKLVVVAACDHIDGTVTRPRFSSSEITPRTGRTAGWRCEIERLEHVFVGGHLDGARRRAVGDARRHGRGGNPEGYRQ